MESAYYRTGGDKDQEAQVKEVYERLTFFKPIVTFHAGVINYEEDVKRILSKSGKLAKGAAGTLAKL